MPELMDAEAPKQRHQSPRPVLERVRSARFLWLYIIAALALGVWLAFLALRGHGTPAATTNVAATPGRSAPPARASAVSGSTEVHAHNLMLRMGPSFRVYVRWLQGRMVATRATKEPSFDDPDSFALDITTGVLRANIGDIQNYLNAGGLGNSPLKNVNLSGGGNQIRLAGTLHKLIPLPVVIMATIAPMPDGRIQIHVTKIDVLKIPLKALLGMMHVQVSDLVGSQNIEGVQIAGNDIYLDPIKLLPPPRIRGQLTAVRVVNPDLEEVFGNAEAEVQRVEQWRNFLRLEGGAINFGKLTMHPVDLIMIDVSNDPWFDLDLAHYQKQLVSGYTRMTPEAGLQIFMPDLDTLPKTQNTNDISIQWMKNRAAPPPKDVFKH
jgi:hypothetical protein